MSFQKIVNINWRDLRYEDKYAGPLKTIQRITINTSLGNRYTYTRQLDETVYPYKVKPNTWEVYKNGQPVYEIDDTTGAPTNVIKTWDIDIIDPILSDFFDTVDPITRRPIEIPTNVVLN